MCLLNVNLFLFLQLKLFDDKPLQPSLNIAGTGARVYTELKAVDLTRLDRQNFNWEAVDAGTFCHIRLCFNEIQDILPLTFERNEEALCRKYFRRVEQQRHWLQIPVLLSVYQHAYQTFVVPHFDCFGRVKKKANTCIRVTSFLSEVLCLVCLRGTRETLCLSLKSEL